MPGPISSTPQLLSTPLASTILGGRPGLMMKFCPKPLESAKSYFSHRVRITERSVSSGIVVFLSVAALSAARAAAPPKGEPLACRSSPYWMRRFSISGTIVPCCSGQTQLNKIQVQKWLPSVAGHCRLRYIQLLASKLKWPGSPVPLPMGEVSPKVTERVTAHSQPPAPLLHRPRRKPLPPLRPRRKRCSRLRPPKRLRRSRRRCQRRSRRPRW